MGNNLGNAQNQRSFFREVFSRRESGRVITLLLIMTFLSSPSSSSNNHDYYHQIITIIIIIIPNINNVLVTECDSGKAPTLLTKRPALSTQMPEGKNSIQIMNTCDNQQVIILYCDYQQVTIILSFKWNIQE